MYKLVCKIIMAAVLGAASFSSSQAEEPDQKSKTRLRYLTTNLGSQVFIAGDTGGNIVKYAMQATAYRNAGSTLHVNGNCDSACTIYLSLPAKQLCVTPGANFRFHAPMATNKRAAAVAHDFVTGKYPKWVLSWIKNNGGLNAKLITMDFTFARQHLPTCATDMAAR